MVYIAGDNDLEKYVVKDLENELAKIGSNQRVRVVALADRIAGDDTSRGDWTQTLLYHVTPGLKATAEAAVADWGERNMGDPATLAEFVSWSRQHYPAQRYALFFWGHGWNWHPGYVMEDVSNQDALDVDKIKAIQPQLGFLDLVAFDGCNMGSIEVETLWQGHAKALVHSQEFVDWDGIEYDVMLQQLNQNPQMSTEQLAMITSRSASLNQERTGSAVVLDQRFTALLQAVDRWTLALIKGLPHYRSRYDQAFAQAQSFFEAPDEKDLYHLASLMLQVPDAEVQTSSRAVMMAIQAVVIDSWHRPDYPQAHGISVSSLGPEDDRDYYSSLDFARLTHWDEFLSQYLPTQNEKTQRSD